MALPGLEIGLSAPNAQLIADMRSAQSVVDASARAMGSSIDGFSGATDRATYAGAKLIKSLQDQVATFGMTRSQLDQYKANLNGVGTEAQALIAKLDALKKAQQDEADAARKAAVHLRAHGDAANEAGGHVEELGFKTARSRTELIVLGHELSQGNYKKFGGSMMVLAEQTGIASLAFTAAGVAILGLGAIVGFLGYAMIKGASEQKAFRDAVVLTGSSAGLTSDGLEKLAHTAAASGGSLTVAKEAMLELANSGRFTVAEILTIGTAATEMEHAAGIAVSETVKQFEELAKKPAEASAKLNEQYHYLTQAVYEQILALEKQGKAVEAAKLAEDTYADAVKQRAGMLDANLGNIERWWNKIKAAVVGAKDAVGDWGKKATSASDLAEIDAKLKGLDQLSSRSGTAMNRNPSTVAALAEAEKQRNVLLAQRAVLQDDINRSEIRAAEVAIQQKSAEEAIHSTSILAAEDAKGKQKSALAIALALNAQTEAQIKANDAIAGTHSAYVTDEAIAERRARTIRLHTLKGSTAGDDTTNTDAADQVAMVKAQFASEKEVYDARLSMLDDYHRKEALSTSDFYAGRKVAITDILAAKRAEYEAESGILANKENRNAVDEARTQKQLDAMFADYNAFAQKMGQVQVKDDIGQLDAEKAAYDGIVKAIINTGDAEIKRLESTLKAQQLHNAEISKSKEQKELEKKAIEDAGTAQLQADADFLNGVLAHNDFDDKSRAAYVIRLQQMQEELDLRHKISGAYQDGAIAEAAATAEKEWRKTADSIDKSLSTAIMNGFTGAKGFAQDFVNSLKGMFSKLVLQPILSPVSGVLASAFSPGAAGQAGSGLLSSLGSSFTSSSLGSSLSSIGGYASSFGSGTLASVGSAVGSTGDAAMLASAAGSGNLAAGAAAGAQFGELVAAAGPYAAAALAAYALYKAFDGGEQRGGGQYAYSVDGTITNARRGTTMAATTGTVGLLEGPSGGEVDSSGVKAAIAATVGSINGYLQGFGSKASLAGFQAGLETSGEGRGGVFAGGALSSGAQFGLSGAGDNYAGTLFDKAFTQSPDSKTAIADFATELKQTTLQALQAANIGGSVGQYLNSLGNIKALDSAAADAALKTLNDMQTLMTAMKALPFDQLKNASLDAMNAIAGLTGGMAALGTKLGSYYTDFYSQGEKDAKILGDVRTALAAVNVSMPATRDQFRALVEAQDLSTDHGQQAYAALMNVAVAFASVVPAATAAANATTALSQAQLDANVTTARSNLTTAYTAQVSAINATITSVQTFADSIKSFKDSLLLGNLSPLNNADKYAQASIQYNATLSDAKGGNAEAQKDLQNQAQSFLQASRAYNASSNAYTSDFAKVMSDLTLTGASAAAQVTTAQQQLVALNQQVTGLVTVNQSVLTVTQAIHDLSAASLAQGRGQGLTGAALLNNGLAPGNPGYLFGADAVNGSHAIGLMSVPFDGYLAELHKGERVLTAGEAMNYSQYGKSDTAPLVAEIRALREEVSGLRGEQRDQTGAVVGALFKAGEMSAESITAGTKEAASATAYADKTKPRFA